MENQITASFANRRPGWRPAELNIHDLQLHSFAELELLAGSRQTCPKCNRSRHLYCYDCLVPFTQVPTLQLPFHVSIITHHAEAPSKNTGVHAALLCPQQVQLHSIDQLPAGDPSRCVVMFPSEDAVLPEQLDMQQVERVIIIDSKWRKAKELNSHKALNGMMRVRECIPCILRPCLLPHPQKFTTSETHVASGLDCASELMAASGAFRIVHCNLELKGAPQVKLPGHPQSCFWRFHTEGVSDAGVCTIEALHLLLTAIAGQLLWQPYQGNTHYFDNLLWYFAFQYNLVTRAAAERKQQQQQHRPQRQPKVQQSKKKKRQLQHQGMEQQNRGHWEQLLSDHVVDGQCQGQQLLREQEHKEQKVDWQQLHHQRQQQQQQDGQQQAGSQPGEQVEELGTYDTGGQQHNKRPKTSATMVE